MPFSKENCRNNVVYAVCIWGVETFSRMEMGAGTFLQTRIGVAKTFFAEQNGGAKTYLDRKITVFPGGVPVNFGHSLTKNPRENIQ